jgi:hypothetical protein
MVKIFQLVGLMTLINVFSPSSTYKNHHITIFHQSWRLPSTFGFEDILSVDDIEIFQTRFNRLRELFPKIEEKLLRDTVQASPIFLSMEPQKFEESISSISKIYPFLDPSYIMAQKSPGLELLLLAISGEFNFEERQDYLHRVIGRDKDIKLFIHKVPHALIPKYTMQLQDFIHNFQEVFPNADRKVAVGIIERSPALLFCRLEADYKKLVNIYSSIGLKFTNKEILVMVKNYPQILTSFHVNKRLQFIKQNYPDWNLKDILVEYTQILGLASTALSGKIEVSHLLSYINPVV